MIRAQFDFIKHLMFHPIDGFYELKTQKKGNVKTAIILNFLAFIMLVIKTNKTGFIFNSAYGQPLDIIYLFCYIVIPVLLFSVANLSITTLMEGEGNFSEIYMVTSYSLVPFIIIWPIETILSNTFSLDEATFLGFATTISIIWFAFLLFFGILSIHNYTPMKNIATFVLTAIAMIIIIFLILLFFNLMSEVVGFIYSIIKELQTR